MKNYVLRMLRFYSEESRHDGTLSIVKAKCTWVVCKEVDKTVNDDISRACGGII